jgi:hypothetical protein
MTLQFFGSYFTVTLVHFASTLMTMVKREFWSFSDHVMQFVFIICSFVFAPVIFSLFCFFVFSPFCFAFVIVEL